MVSKEYSVKVRKGVVRALQAATFGLAVSLAHVPSLYAQPALDGLSSLALGKLAEPQAMAEALAAGTGRPLRVIVEFAPPSLPAGIQSTSDQADGLVIAGVRRMQDGILGRVLGSARADGPAVSEDELSLRRMTYSPMFALNVDAALLAVLAEDPEVVRIHIDGLSPPSLTQTLPLIGVPAAISAGATGSGQVVAVLDTGALVDHEFLANRIVAGACYNTAIAQYESTSRCPGGAQSATTIASGTDCTSAAIAGCGHGTHVAGTAAGWVANPSSGYPAHGVARDARIMTINVFAQFPRTQCGGGVTASQTHCLLSFDSDQISALDRVYALRGTHNFAAVNMSLGGGQNSSACAADTRRDAIQRLRNAGIAVVVAAGNNGYSNAVSSPACIPEAISVGNTTNADARSATSNWGTLVDIAAPGTSVLASHISGSSRNTYAYLTGTSMAAPHVAGAFAAIRSAVPGASVDQIEAALKATGTPVTFAGVTVPRINVDQALSQLRGTPTTTRLSGPATGTQGESLTFTATVTSGSGTPAGTVSFRRDGVQFGTATLSGGTASLSSAALSSGTHQITAVYLGSATHQASTSAARSVVITNPAAPPNDNFASRTVISAPGTYAGTNVGATRETGEPATIAGRNNSNSVWWRFTPSASGELTIDTIGSNFDTLLGVYTGTSVSALSLVASNDDFSGLQSRVRFNATAGTRYQIAVAGYSGASGSIALNVALEASGPAATTTTLSGPTTGVSGQSRTFTATVASAVGTPSGTVSFRRGGTQFATALLSAGGTASVSTSVLPVGTSQITAHYIGNATHSASNSNIVSIVITPATASTTTVISGASAGVVGQSLTYSATVSSGGGTPTGTVSFRRDGTQFATASLSGGMASVTTSSLPVGSHDITARYVGATGYAASTSSAVRVTVNAAPAGPAGFAGGGTVFGFTDACAPTWAQRSESVTVQYSPSELNEFPSQVTVAWRDGGEHIALWGPMTPSTQFFGAAGRATWSRFVFYPLRPLVRVVQRAVISPAGATLANAQELNLRLRVQNLSAIPGCAATIAATLRRR